MGTAHPNVMHNCVEACYVVARVYHGKRRGGGGGGARAPRLNSPSSRPFEKLPLCFVWTLSVVLAEHLADALQVSKDTVPSYLPMVVVVFGIF